MTPPPFVLPAEKVDHVVLNGSAGWSVSNHGTVSRSQDGGTTWAPMGKVTATPPTSSGMFFLAVATGTVLWALRNNFWDGWPRVFHTVDGGLQWTEVSLPPKLFTGFDFANIVAIDSRTVFVSNSAALQGPLSPNRDENRAVLVTKDAGQTWVIKAFDPDQILPSGVMWSVRGGEVLRSGDFAQTYTATRLVSDGQLFKVRFANESRGLALGRTASEVYALWQTRDGGASWVKLQAQGLPSESRCLQGNGDHMITFTSPDVVRLSVGSFGCIYALRSTDGGLTWVVLPGER